MPRDLKAELDGDGPDRPPSWEHEPGDVLIGTIVRYEQAETKRGLSPIMVVRDDEGAVFAVWLTPTVLMSELRKLRPKPGERIGLKRLEDHEKGYQMWRVVLDRPEGAYSPWGEGNNTRATPESPKQQEPPATPPRPPRREVTEDEIPF